MQVQYKTKNDNIIISKADKSDSAVVLLAAECLELAHVHLNDKEKYQILSEDPTQVISLQFIQYLNTCKQKGVSTGKQFDRLKPPQNVDMQTIYFLP